MIRASAVLAVIAVAACGPKAPTGVALVGATLIALAAAGALIMYRGGPDVSNIMYHSSPHVSNVMYHG